MNLCAVSLFISVGQGAVLNKQGDPLDVKRILKNQQRLDRDYNQHKADFLEANPLFFERLQRRPDHSLTWLDLKIVLIS